jgi:hypothetical protein
VSRPGRLASVNRLRVGVLLGYLNILSTDSHVDATEHATTAPGRSVELLRSWYNGAELHFMLLVVQIFPIAERALRCRPAGQSKQTSLELVA